MLERSARERSGEISRGCWCPGAESNHRHGDFQSLEARREERASLWGRSSGTPQDPSRQVRRSTVMHGLAFSVHAGSARAWADRQQGSVRPAVIFGPSLGSSAPHSRRYRRESGTLAEERCAGRRELSSARAGVPPDADGPLELHRRYHRRESLTGVMLATGTIRRPRGSSRRSSHRIARVVPRIADGLMWGAGAVPLGGPLRRWNPSEIAFHDLERDVQKQTQMWGPSPPRRTVAVFRSRLFPTAAHIAASNTSAIYPRRGRAFRSR